MHIQIRNEANLLQQQLVSLEANIGENEHLERVLQAISCLDFIDQAQTDSYLQEMQTGLQLLTQQLKQKNATSILVINSVNDVNTSFKRLRSLYIQRRLQLFKEKVDPEQARQNSYNPGLKLEQNLQMNLRRMDGQTNAKLHQIYSEIDRQLSQIHSQLMRANPQPIDLNLFTNDTQKMLSELEQTSDKLQETQKLIEFPNIDELVQKVRQINTEFTASFKKSLDQAQQISSLFV